MALSRSASAMSATTANNLKSHPSRQCVSVKTSLYPYLPLNSSASVLSISQEGLPFATAHATATAACSPLPVAR